MFLKETGYDEFLAHKIEQGLEDVKNGRLYSAEQAKARINETLARKAKELEQLEQENLIYG